MQYIKRDLERKFMKMNEAFKVIMVTGARQVGKSTMLKHLAEDTNRKYVTMDNIKDRQLAKKDPELFFQKYEPPILIDEVQKAPELFEKIKEISDQKEENGLFWLTGSQSVKLIKEAGDSLAGRICVLKMYSLSQREKVRTLSVSKLDFSNTSMYEREKSLKSVSVVDIFDNIWRGGMPGTVDMDNEQLYEYYSSYIESYLMRDAVDDNGITNVSGFRKVLMATAAFIGNILNYAEIANIAEVSIPTVKKWIEVLENMGVIILLKPYSNNQLKRLVKTPKLYFCDTGLAAYLSMWTSTNVLMNGAASGHYFENFVVAELIKNYSYSSQNVNITYYRDTNQKEIDLVVEEDNVLHPLEIKLSANPEKREIKKFDLLEKSSSNLGNGGIICMTDTVFPINQQNYMIPAWII